MIVKDLYDLYERYAADPQMQDKVPPKGMSREKVEWELVLSKSGELVNVISLSHGDGKGANRFREMLVPEHDGRSGPNPKPYFLCDTAVYLLGMADISKAKDESEVVKAQRKAQERWEASRDYHLSILSSCDDVAAQAVMGFFSHNILKERENDDLLRDLAESGNLIFALKDSDGNIVPIHESKAIMAAWESSRVSALADEPCISGQCSVTGKAAPLARLFPQVTGLAGAQSSGASLISFNCDSFNSYGRTQAYNASVSQRVAFGAGTALKMLLSDPERKIRLGATTFTFWSDRPSPDEDSLFIRFFGGGDKNDTAEDSATVTRVRDAIKGIKSGHPLRANFNPDVRYYVLGISPNAARLSVRFFETSTLGEVAERYGQYLRDIDMVDVSTTSIFQLIRQCAVQGKYENLPSTLVNPCMRAMLTGSRFPQSLLSTLLSRMRADHGSYEVKDKTYEVTDWRAVLIKAFLVRNRRLSGILPTKEREIGMALNRDNESVGYLLGRLFAVMEKTQQYAADAQLNTTIRDKYIGSASVTPARVMPTLMHGCQNHLSDLRKKKPGLNVILEKELDEIVGRKLSDNPYPGTLSMEDQGEFFIGYYQERVDLWTSRKRDDVAPDEAASNDLSEN